MKKIKDMINKKYAFYLLFAVGGLLVGWLLFGLSSNKMKTEESHEGHSHELVQDESGVWTCSMHPQIRQDKPGKCPICAMDLIPVKKSAGGQTDGVVDPAAIQLSEEAVALANVQTSLISRSNPVKNVHLYGKIAADERSLQSQTAYVGGRIERLNVEFTGESVRVGQTLATIYSPELFTAQQELLEATQMKQPQLIQAAREKLRLWNMTDNQINNIVRSGQASPLVDIKANTNGVVISKRVSRGDYVSQGSVLFDIANLSRVWAVFEAFEVDLPFISKGDRINFTLTALPGKHFSGVISFIDPMVNATTRTARVRVDISNPKGELKPEMYTLAEVNAPLKGYKNEIVIPQTAVLWTGKRSIVYVRQPNISTPTFQLREIELGPSLGGSYVVMKGLSDGEEIVTDGAFSIDASAQLEGKKSMMNPDHAKTMTGHAEHTGHVMPAKASTNEAAMGSMATHKLHSAPQKQASFIVQGNCGMCKQRIEQAATGVKGVSSATWDSSTKKLTLKFDEKQTTLSIISKAVAKAGHDTEKDKAPLTVYKSLPGCCLYRK